MNQNEEIRVLYVQPGKYPEEIKIPNTLETFQKYVCGIIALSILQKGGNLLKFDV